MKYFSRVVPIFAGVVAVNGALGSVAAGCGSNNASNSSPEDGGMDATTDSGGDVAQQGDAVQESAAMDAPVGPDAGAADADANAADADASAADAEGDGAQGLDANAGPDGDAGGADSPVGYEGTAATFPGQVAATVCERVANCCGTSADAATFNFAACYADLLPSGYNGSNTGSNLLDGGHVVFNAVAAQACLGALNQIDCQTNEIPAAIQTLAYMNCFAALSGTLPAGSPCAGTIECSSGNFCLPLDGGVGDAGAIGLCQAIVGDGGACGNLLGTPSASQAACSYRGSGNTNLFCKSFDPSVPSESIDAAAWTCAPQEPVGTGCGRNVACSSFECTTGLQCAAALVAVTTATCTGFALDAGTPTDASGQ